MSASPYHFTLLGDTKECNNKCGYKLSLSYQPASAGSTVCLTPPVMCNASSPAEADYQGEFEVDVHNNLDYAVMVTVRAVPTMSFSFQVLGRNNQEIDIPNTHQLRSVRARSVIGNIYCEPFVSEYPLPAQNYAFVVNRSIGQPPCFVALSEPFP